MKIGTCKLCKEEKELIRKAHIIPDFIYRESKLFDENHKIVLLRKDDLKNDKKSQEVQSGFYESNLLCANCDNKIIGQYEDYARIAFYGGAYSPYGNPKCSVTEYESICENISYTKFKLFLLSILFKASISISNFFREVTISEENIEDIRLMLINGDAKNVLDFPILVSTFKFSEVPEQMIIAPRKSIIDGENVYTFVFSGMLFSFYEGLQVNLSDFEYTLFPDNTMRILHIPINNGKPIIEKLLL